MKCLNPSLSSLSLCAILLLLGCSSQEANPKIVASDGVKNWVPNEDVRYQVSSFDPDDVKKVVISGKGLSGKGKYTRDPIVISSASEIAEVYKLLAAAEIRKGETARSWLLDDGFITFHLQNGKNPYVKFFYSRCRAEVGIPFQRFLLRKVVLSPEDFSVMNRPAKPIPREVDARFQERLDAADKVGFLRVTIQRGQETLELNASRTSAVISALACSSRQVGWSRPSGVVDDMKIVLEAPNPQDTITVSLCRKYLKQEFGSVVEEFFLNVEGPPKGNSKNSSADLGNSSLSNKPQQVSSR